MYRVIWKIITLASLFASASCSKSVEVTVNKLDSATIFHFGIKRIFDRSYDPICLRILEVRDSLTERIVWKISKKASNCALVNQITLGENVPDFNEQIDQLPLNPNSKYVVSIVADEGAATSGEW